MEHSRMLYHINLVLKIILIILFIYMLFAGYQFFTWTSSWSSVNAGVVSSCNAAAQLESHGAYCCEARQVFINSQEITQTCTGLESSGTVSGITYLDCSTVLCPAL